MRVQKAKFASESAMCEAFIAALPKGWTAYRETAGWDIVLVHNTGAQVGIEAKLALNAEVLRQSLPRVSPWIYTDNGPDFRGVLIPDGASRTLEFAFAWAGVTILRMKDHDDRSIYYGRYPYYPHLPPHGEWYDWCPYRRLTLPEYVPADIVAGASAPQKLSEWKINAIRLVITLERRGFVTNADFRHLRISPTRWTQPPGYSWLQKGQQRGTWLATDRMPDFRLQHPTNFAEIEADFEKWAPPAAELQVQQPLFGEAAE